MDDESAPSSEQVRPIVAHFAHLRAAYGDPFAAPTLIEPNGEFFPDEFALEPEAIHRLFVRMTTYAPISDDLDLKLGFIEPDQQSSGGSCGSGACGTGGLKEIARGGAIETEEGYAAMVHTSDVGDSSILTTSLARSIGRIVLFEADEEVDPREEGVLSELTAIAAGYGLLLLNGACVYKKGCGGMKRHQATYLDIQDIAIALALFVRTTEAKPAAVRKHLAGVTQKEAFDDALAWVDSQPSLVRRLVDQPETLEDGVFELEARKGLLSRFFSKKAPRLDDAPTSSKARPRSEDELRRIAEAKALVDEALGS